MADKTLTEAAKELGVSSSTLRVQIKNHKLTATKDRWGYNLISTDEIQRYKAEHRQPNKNKPKP